MSPEAASGLRPVLVLGNRALHGQERGNMEVVRALRAAGAEPLVATSAWWGHERIQPYLEALGVPWRSVPYAVHFTKRLPKRAWPANVRRLARGSAVFGRLLREHGATHVQLANPHYALAVLPALLGTRLPVVYRLGDEPTRHHPLYRLLWRVLAWRVQRFVCVSDFVRRQAEACGLPSAKLVVIRSHPSVRPTPARPFAVPPFDGRSFVYVGQIGPHKGVHVLVEAALRLCRERPDVRLLMAGDYTWRNPFAQALMGEVAAAGLSERIVFLGYVEDVPGLLAMADVHVCPSVWQEPLANTVVEAKRAGCPSVVTAVGGLPELVEEGEDGWVVAGGDVEALYGALRRCAELPVERLRARGQAAHASLERLGITEERFTRAWIEVYRTTAATR